jgi:hypothetical protein
VVEAKTYHGRGFSDAGPGAVTVKIGEDAQYDLSDKYGPDNDDAPNHSPDGFQAGYGGSGPAQLAWALVADAVDVESANKWYQRFKDDVVADFNDDSDEFVLDAAFVHNTVARYEANEAAAQDK